MTEEAACPAARSSLPVHTSSFAPHHRGLCSTHVLQEAGHFKVRQVADIVDPSPSSLLVEPEHHLITLLCTLVHVAYRPCQTLAWPGVSAGRWARQRGLIKGRSSDFLCYLFECMIWSDLCLTLVPLLVTQMCFIDSTITCLMGVCVCYRNHVAVSLH